MTMPIPSVLWTTPSRDSSGSMPIGNGDIAANVWVEAGSGDLLLLLAKSDAWDQWGRLLKLGRVRIHCEPSSPFMEGTFITQTLHLEEGCIRVTGRCDENHQATLTVFADAQAPVIRIQLDAPAHYSLKTSYESWRTAPRPLSNEEMGGGSSYGRSATELPIETPDILLADFPRGFAWYHRNPTSVYPSMLRLQGLTHLADKPDFSDPLLHRTFGGALHRPDPCSVDIYLHTQIADNESDFLAALEAQIARYSIASHASRHFPAHVAWWKAFWNRSHIQATGTAEAQTVSRGYTLQRYITACAGRGAYPIKFNGSLFTVDPADGRFTPDYRRWGGGYWIQNTRLAYWPMLASGDFEMLQPCFAMYLRHMAVARERHGIFFNRPDAGFLPETAAFYGLPLAGEYGGFDWSRPGASAVISCPYINRHWNGMLELGMMMLDYVAYTGDSEFLTQSAIPFIDSALRFFDSQNYTRENGRMVITASTAMETWWSCLNPMPDVAGLRALTSRLLALDPSSSTADQRAYWSQLAALLPEIPMRADTPDAPTLAPAASFARKQNVETPEMYGVFPFRLHGICREHLEPARRAFARRENPMNCGWAQDEIFAAHLGLTSEAATLLAQRYATHDPNQRFEAFWGPNFDWTPDQDHGCSGQIALQAMLLQPLEDGRVLLFPSWPAEWDVDFKLHAPQGTVVEATLVAGQLTRLIVKPESRRKDMQCTIRPATPGDNCNQCPDSEVRT